MFPNIWDIHSAEPHPDPPENPVLAPNYRLVGALLDVDQSKDTYNSMNKNFQEDADINFALTERFLSLFAAEHSQDYCNLIVQDPVQ